VGQMKRMGSSLDWSREAFTMDPVLFSLAFFLFYKFFYNDKLLFFYLAEELGTIFGNREKLVFRVFLVFFFFSCLKKWAN
jgi:leucyl-tRNA synthetase